MENFVKKVTDDKAAAKQNMGITEMFNVLEKLPQTRQTDLSLKKNVDVIDFLAKAIEKKQLINVSKIEQDIACHNERKDQFNAVLSVLTDPNYELYEKLRLVLLFALRYEGEYDVGINQLKDELKKALQNEGRKLGWTRFQLDDKISKTINLVTYLLDYCGK